MLFLVPYDVSKKKARKAAKGTRSGLCRKGASDAMSEDETHSSSTEDDNEEEEEEDDSPPEAGRKKRAASKNLEPKAPKRGKGSPRITLRGMSIAVQSGLPGPSLELNRKYQEFLRAPERPSFPPCNV